jgi:hypothetical protein
MLSAWKLELATTPDDFPHIRTTPFVHLRAPAYPPSADDDILPRSEFHVMPTITDDIRPVSPPLADTVSAPILELPLTQEVPPTFESLTPTELIQPLTVELTSRPRHAAAANAQTPGFYRHLANVNTINTLRDPYDDIYGCNMHFAKAATDYGHDLATAAGNKEVINIFGSLKAVTPVHASTLSSEELRAVLPSFMFYKAKELNPAELAAAEAAQAHKDSISTLSRQDKKKAIYKFKLKAR